MKLLYIVNEPAFFISHRLPIALAAKEKGWEVHVATKPGKACKDISYKGFIHHPIQLSRSGANPFIELKSLINIRLLLNNVKPDVIHLVTIKPVIYGSIASKFTDVDKVVCAISGMGSLFIGEDLNSKIKKAIAKSLYKFSLKSKKTVVIFQNPDDLKLLLSLKAINQKQAIIIKGSGVNLNQFKNFPEDLNNKPVVTFAARLLFDKGLAEFIEAVNILNERGINATYNLIGDVDLGNPTSASIKDLNKWQKINNLNISGYQKDIATFFQKSNMVVLPSYREGLPKVLIEAAACGRAVITTDVPGCRDAIIENETGLLVPIKDSKALADAIEYLVLNPKIRQKMGEKGRKLAENEFSIDDVVSKHLDIYQSV